MEQTKRKKNQLWILFYSTLRLSAFTIGGGYVIVPLMRTLFVDNYGWIDKEEMLDIIAIAQSSPGPIAVNTSILVGYKIKGFKGALVTLLGTILPPMILLSLLSLVYTRIKENVIVESLLFGMGIGVAAVILHAVFVMAKAVTSKREILPVIIMILTFILSYVVNISIIYVLLTGAVIGLIHYYRSLKGGE
ncbi:MAG: chromate transporter [Sphaerochaetaceae bacterium]|nr:chromate transporter [Sphaerochaetaceae bacterium]